MGLTIEINNESATTYFSKTTVNGNYDVGEWAWLTTPELQAEWRQAALAGRELLPGWDSTARWVLDVIGGGTPRG